MFPLLLVFHAFKNSFIHLDQSYYSFEVKEALSHQKVVPEKVTYFNNFSTIFHFRTKEESSDRLISNINLNRGVYYNKNEMFDVIEIYSVYTSKDYRKRGLARQMIYRSVYYMIKHHKLHCPVLALHLNTKDPMMHVSFSFYVNLGFHQACYVKWGPACMKYSMEEKNFFSWKELLDRPVTAPHISLFAFNGFNNDVKGDFTEMGKKLVKKVKTWIDENPNQVEPDADSD